MQEGEQKLVLDQQIPEVVTQPKGCLQIMANEQPPHFFTDSAPFFGIFDVCSMSQKMLLSGAKCTTNRILPKGFTSVDCEFV